MFAASNVFLDFNLPNATTWFYFSLLLAVALFFKFGRLLSVRNLDVPTLFFVVPGLLMVQHARNNVAPPTQAQAAVAADSVSQMFAPALGGAALPFEPVVLALHPAVTQSAALNWTFLGYLSILLGSGYFFFRCLMDLTLVQRPALSPNLTLGGSIWLAAALFVCLATVAFRQPEPGRLPDPALTGANAPVAVQKVGPESAPLALARESLTDYTWLLRSVAVFCHLLVVVGLALIGRFHFQDTASGMAAATFYLILPYTGLFVGQAHHVWPMALIVWAVLFYRYPTVAGTLLGVAGATSYFPALIVPLWASFYWRRGAGRFLLAALVSAAICLSVTGVILWYQGELENSLEQAFRHGAWQPWQAPPPGTEGFWTGLHWVYRIPLFIAFVAFVLVTPFWPMPKNLAQVLALSAAVIVGIQFWYANQGGVYVLWYLPLLLLLVFRPNLEDRRPPLLDAETDWAARLVRSIGGFVRWIVHRPQPEKAVK